MNSNQNLVSYCLFTYNQEKYIKEAIEGALSQTYSPLEIIISDDCSSDSTLEVIKDTVKNYKGPHSIVINRNETNIGIGAHVSKICYSTSKGRYLVLLGGDDISMPNHVMQAVENLEKYTDVNLIDFTAEIINEKSDFVRKINLDYKYKKFTLNDYISLKNIQSFAPGRILRKELIQTFNPISNKCPTEDSVFVLRSLLTGGFVRVNISLVQYRQHGANISSLTGMKKISHSAIISQYLVDVIQLNNKGIIPEKLFYTLVKRIYLELKLRKIKYTNTSLINKIFNKILIKFLRFSYLMSKR